MPFVFGNEEYMAYDEAAVYTRVTIRTVRSWVSKGLVEVYTMPSGRKLIPVKGLFKPGTVEIFTEESGRNRKK